MAMRCQCIANKAFTNRRLTRVWSRSFIDGGHSAEGSTPRRVSSRVQAQRESADAIQKLAQSRQQQGGTLMRKVVLTSALGDESELPSFPPSQLRRAPLSRSKQGSQRGSQQQFQPRPRRKFQGAKSSESEESSRHRRNTTDDFFPELDSGGDAMTTEEHDAYLAKLGEVKKDSITTFPGPTLDMASLMLEYAPRHFGATEPVSGHYPSMTDTRSRGLLQDIVRQVRKNETYSEKNIEQLVKKLGPAMPTPLSS